MKKGIVLIVMFGLVGLSGKGQITFQKMFYSDTFSTIAVSVKQTSDGGYIVVGPFNGGGTILVRTDSIGNLLWTKEFSPANGGCAIAVQQTIDGGFVMVGTTLNSNIIFLIKTDSFGDTIFTKTYTKGNAYSSGSSILQTPDGGYIISGYNNSYGIFLIRTNGIGDTLWTKTIGGSYENNFIKFTNDGGYIICSSIQVDTTVDLVRIYITRTDSNGIPYWSKEFGGFHDHSHSYGTCIEQTTDNGFIISGYTNILTNSLSNNVYLIRIDSTGDILWTKTYGGTNGDKAYYVHQTIDGGFMVIGNTASFGAGENDLYLIKTNENGDTLFTKTIGTSGNEMAYTADTTNDGGYIIGGSISRRYTNQIFIVKTDALGNVECNQNTTSTITNLAPTIDKIDTNVINKGGIVGTMSPFIFSYNHDSSLCTATTGIKDFQSLSLILSLSPNPFSTTTTLTLQSTYHNPSLFIYNLLGQEVGASRTYGMPVHVGTNYQFTIPRNNLPAGMYFYKVIDENKEIIGIGKMMVE